MEQDDFYQKLPYTLPEEQVKPDYVIFGTGLQECLIAAHKSKMQSKIGLIIDTEKTYGSSLKTVTLKQFHELTSLKQKEKMYEFITPAPWVEQNGKYFDWCLQNKKHRGYSIDIEPNFFLGSSLTCQCLKQADMDKYMDFHLVNNILYIYNNTFRPVPLSKGKIFESKELSLLEKKTLLMSLHKLIKIYQRFMKLEEDMNSTKEFDKDFGDIDEGLYKQFEANLNLFFLPFIQKLVKKNKKILNYLTYIICNYQYNIEKTIPVYAAEIYTLKGFIQQFGKFIKSCGIYGQSPYLYVDNGIGDIPQAFSRISSIYGSTYVLHPKITIESIQKKQDQYHIISNLSPERPIVTKEIYYGPTYLDLRKVEEQFIEEKILRVLILAEKSGNEERCPAVCFITELVEFVNPVYLFFFDNSTQSCPENLIIYQFETILEETYEDANKKADKLVETMTKIYGQNFKASIKYYSVCIRTRRYPKASQEEDKTSVGLNDTIGIDLDQHFANFIKIVGTKQNYFKKDQQQNLEDEQPFGGYDTNYLLEKLDNINLKDQPPAAVPQTEQKVQEQLPATQSAQASEPSKQIQISDKFPTEEAAVQPTDPLTHQQAQNASASSQ